MYDNILIVSHTLYMYIFNTHKNISFLDPADLNYDNWDTCIAENIHSSYTIHI